jgi:hypothetical protein
MKADVLNVTVNAHWSMRKKRVSAVDRERAERGTALDRW